MSPIRRVWRIVANALRLLRQPAPALPRESAHPYREAAPAPPPEPTECGYTLYWHIHSDGTAEYIGAIPIPRPPRNPVHEE